MFIAIKTFVVGIVAWGRRGGGRLVRYASRGSDTVVRRVGFPRLLERRFGGGGLPSAVNSTQVMVTTRWGFGPPLR